MKLNSVIRLATAVAVCSLLATGGQAGEKSLNVSVRASIAKDYERVRLPGGGFKPERYVIADGGMFNGTTRNASFDKVSYPEVAGLVARHLAASQYHLADKAKDADLLIAIYWGGTVPFNDVNYDLAVDNFARVQAAEGPGPTLAERMTGPSAGELFALASLTGNLEFAIALLEMRNRERDSLNVFNARLLGYTNAVNDRREMLAWSDIGDVQAGLLSDIEEERYYVVVQAYDFKSLQREGKQVLRWVTRISIGARGTGFDERVAQMVAAAAKSFGGRHGLQRRFYGDPRVELGETKYLGQASVPEPEEKK